MFNIIMKIVTLTLILIGIVFIYDARTLTKRFFSFGDQNEGASGLKFLGSILSIIGGIILFNLTK